MLVLVLMLVRPKTGRAYESVAIVQTRRVKASQKDLVLAKSSICMTNCEWTRQCD